MTNVDLRQIGLQLVQSGHFAQALPVVLEANRRAPGDLPILHTLAQLLQQAGRGREAAERYRVAATIAPQEPGVLAGWARATLLIGDMAATVATLHDLLALASAQEAAHAHLHALLRELDRPQLACALLQPLVERRPADTVLLRLYARSLLDCERLADAQQALERHRDLLPADPYPHVELGRLALNCGDTPAARHHFKAALRVDPDYAAALWNLAHLDGGKLDRATVTRIEDLIETSRDPKASAGLHDILARHHDRVGAFKAATGHIRQANALMRSMSPPALAYEETRHAAEIDATLRYYTAQRLQRLRGSGNPDARPLFVVGLPRSGTTLLERMLAAHPAIAGIGEQGLAMASLQQAQAASQGSGEELAPVAVRAASAWHLQALDRAARRLGDALGARHVVDKMPDNYLLAGWLRIAFPNAAIIHCVRDPRDVAFSCWFTQFAAVPWSFDLGHIAHRIEQHRRLLHHWRSLPGNAIADIRYEALVADPERQLRRVLRAIGLEWHPDMLQFHRGRGFVGSASMHQVRQPLNTRSIARWRNYTHALRPVLRRLDDVALQDDIDLATIDGG